MMANERETGISAKGEQQFLERIQALTRAQREIETHPQVLNMTEYSTYAGAIIADEGRWPGLRADVAIAVKMLDTREAFGVADPKKELVSSIRAESPEVVRYDIEARRVEYLQEILSQAERYRDQSIKQRRDVEGNSITDIYIKVVEELDPPSHILDNGAKEWRNAEGELHRDGGPAIETTDGTKKWYQNEDLHREDGPAIENADGSKEYALYGFHFTEKEYKQELKFLKEIDRMDDLASTSIDGHGAKNWRNEGGQLHRIGGPAIIDRVQGCIEYYQYGKIHREDGPAFLNSTGEKAYYLKGEETTRSAIEKIMKSNDFMNRPLPPGTGTAREYCIEARKMIALNGQWPGKSADADIAKKLLQQGHDKSKIIEAIRGKSPEMGGKDLSESRAYAKSMIDKSLTPEIKKERQRAASRER